MKDGQYTLTVPITITPANKYHCGSCAGWGYVWAGQRCVVFRERLEFDHHDENCMTFGYLRCPACVAWETEQKTP